MLAGQKYDIHFVCDICNTETQISNYQLEQFIEWSIPYPEFKLCRKCRINRMWKEYICIRCNKTFKVTYRQFSNRRRTINSTGLCFECIESDKNKRLQAGHRKFLDTLSPDEKILYAKVRKDWYKKLSSKEKKSWSMRSKKQWLLKSPEERRVFINNLTMHSRIKANSLSEDKKYSGPMFSIGPTEYDFNDTLKLNGFIENIHYKWDYWSYPYINPEYYNIYGKNNPVTGKENFPYHNWDFIIYSKTGDHILIDLDGSIHISGMNFKRDGNNFTEREKIDYNDSQRLHKIPTGFSAYIIQCYDNKLTDKTPVLNVLTGNKITYKDLLTILLFTQFTKKKLRKMLNN